MENSWDVIAVTCSQQFSSYVEKEMKYIQRQLNIPTATSILTVEDPFNEVGSGAATLNALLVVTEYLSAQKDYTVMNSDVLTGARVLVLHLGKHCIYSYCGNAFIELPTQSSQVSKSSDVSIHGFSTNLELLLNVINNLRKESPPGIWICSTNMSILSYDIDTLKTTVSWNSKPDSVLFSSLVTPKYAVNHGAINIDDQGFVKDIIYRASELSLQNYIHRNGLVPIISGVVYLSTCVVESLLNLHIMSEFQSCTYMGVDNGTISAQASLFFDILLAMARDVQKSSFVKGDHGQLYNKNVGFSESRVKEMQYMRTLVWDKISNYNMTAAILEDCKYIYWSDFLPVANYIRDLGSIAPFGLYHSAVIVPNKIFQISNHCLINSDINVENCFNVHNDAIVCDSRIYGNCPDIKEGCFISGIDFKNCSSSYLSNLQGNIAVINYQIQTADIDCITFVFGIYDHLHLPILDPQSTFANQPWAKLFEVFPQSYIWDEQIEPSCRTLFNATLYTDWTSLPNFLLLLTKPNSDELNKWKESQRYSMSDVITIIDFEKQFICRRNIYASVASTKIKMILCENQETSLLTYIHSACSSGWTNQLIKVLDSILVTETEAVILTRTLYIMADLLASMAGKTGSLRNGPGCNNSFMHAFQEICNGNLNEGMKDLISERQNWLNKPIYLMRAARHFERAAQLLIQKSVHTVEKFIKLELKTQIPMNQWVQVECPARIDLQGGWTDTPPISYELGGSVVNIAITFDGKKPIGAKARRIEKTCIQLLYSADGVENTVCINKMENLLDYNQPHAKGALLKAAVIYSQLIDINSSLPLQDQLLQNISSGIQIYSWSNFPQGCGLGTSSILAGAIIACLWTVMGKVFEDSSVIHAVLCIEQLLTTGGGWQDQVGGVIGGIKHGFSKPGLPHKINIAPLQVSLEFINTLSSHILLIYTGKVRLAKNLLQTVIRNWYAKDPVIVNCFKNLIASSLEMKKYILNNDLKKIGSLLNQYRKQKLMLAPGCEPDIVRKIRKVLQPVVYGQALTGAGGGGFMCIITKEPNMLPEIQKLLLLVKEADKMTIHSVMCDTDGLVLL